MNPKIKKIAKKTNLLITDVKIKVGKVVLENFLN